MIANGGIINCSRKCHSIKLNMGEYLLNSPMIAIRMGGDDVVLGVKWLQSSRTMALSFQYLFTSFSCEGHNFYDGHNFLVAFTLIFYGQITLHCHFRTSGGVFIG